VHQSFAELVGSESNIPHLHPLYDHGGEIILLLCSVRELEDRLIEFGDNVFRRGVSKRPNDIFHPLNTELLSGFVLPLEEAIRRQQYQVTATELQVS
jgi:hypothetical protein